MARRRIQMAAAVAVALVTMATSSVLGQEGTDLETPPSSPLDASPALESSEPIDETSEPITGGDTPPRVRDEENGGSPSPDSSQAATADPLDQAVAAVDSALDALRLQIHGFASQGVLLSVHNDYLARTTDLSFEFTEVALNVTSEPIENLRIGIQLFSRDLGDIGNYTVRLDWFYVAYQFADWLGIRVGRTKIPFGLYNELSDVDVARVPALLPQSLYPTTSRDFLLAQTGAELYGRIPLDILGALQYRLYAGTIFIDLPPANPANPITFTSIHVPYVTGGRLLWETPLPGLRVGGSAQVLEIDASYQDAAGMGGNYDILGVLWVVSAEYATGDLLFGAEYGRWHVGSTGTDPRANTYRVSERAHAMAAYRVTPWFYPGLYYSLQYNDTRVRTGRAAQQHDIALTLRFDINDFLILKLEGHYMHGTGALSAALNGAPTSALEENWALFLVKLTGYF